MSRGKMDRSGEDLRKHLVDDRKFLWRDSMKRREELKPVIRKQIGRGTFYRGPGASHFYCVTAFRPE